MAMSSLKLLCAAMLLLAVVHSAAAKKGASGAPQNNCEDKCPDNVDPICASHFDTGCKPSWWGELPQCKRINPKLKRTRVVFLNACKYKCIQKQYAFEKWQNHGKVKKMSAYCKKQWKEQPLWWVDEKCKKC